MGMNVWNCIQYILSPYDTSSKNLWELESLTLIHPRISLSVSSYFWMAGIYPQLPVHYTPRICFGVFLSEISKVLVIKLPVIPSCCQIPNDVTILHQKGGFNRISLCVDTHKDLVRCDPHFNWIDMFRLLIWLQYDAWLVIWWCHVTWKTEMETVRVFLII